MATERLENAPAHVQLSVIIPTVKQVETAMLLARRIKCLLPSLALEVIVITPFAAERPIAGSAIRFIADEGRGVYAAYNVGLHSASGDYIWFVGDDDYPLDGAASISEILQEGAVDLLVAPVLFSSGRIYRPTQTQLLLHFLNWCQQGVIYRRRALLRHKFFRRLTVQADQYVNIRMRSDPAVKVRFLKEPICMFGVNGVSGRTRDEAYRSLRLALAHRTLDRSQFIAFRALVMVEPLIKRLIKIR